MEALWEKSMRHRPEYDLKVIGENLKRLRKKNGFSVDEVREYLHMGTVQAIYKYERGAGYPPADMLLALMDLYHADYHDIVDLMSVVLKGNIAQSIENFTKHRG